MDNIDYEKQLLEHAYKFKHIKMMDMVVGLNRTELAIIEVARQCMKSSGASSVKVSKISEKSGMPMPMISRSLNCLEERGYIKREIDTSDRRSTLVEVTEKGFEAVKKAHEILNGFTRDVLSVFTSDEKKELFRLLGKLKDSVNEEIDKRTEKKGECKE